jgi:hypothetical protein
MLLLHFDRFAASRTFWMAGSSSPIKTPMMAITTNSSIRVKPELRRSFGQAKTMATLLRTVCDEQSRLKAGPLAVEGDWHPG